MVTSPHDWQEVQLREVLETDAIAITPEPNRLYAYFTVPGYDEKRFPYPEYGRNILSSKFVVNRRRLLICKINPRLSRIHFADYASDNPQICSTEFIPFKVDEESVNPEYVLFALKTPEASQFFQSRATGTSNSHKRMRPQDILDFPLPLPSLAEQKRIANILNHAEDLRILRRRTNKLTGKIIQAVFLKTFDDPQTNPKRWATATLLEISAEKPQYGSGAKAVPFDGKTRYIRITDVREDGSLRQDSLVSPAEFNKKYLLRRGDVLFARSGATVGKTYLHNDNDDDSIYAGYMIRFRVNQDICNPIFLHALTKTEAFRNWLRSTKTQVAQPNINARQYGSMEVILPPLELQNRFASSVVKIEAARKAQDQATLETDNLFQSLMHKAFKGELELGNAT